MSHISHICLCYSAGNDYKFCIPYHGDAELEPITLESEPASGSEKLQPEPPQNLPGSVTLLKMQETRVVLTTDNVLMVMVPYGV